jgi:hypothetical protein
MTAAKELFCRKEPGKQSLAEWWVSICHDARFQQVLVFARADAAQLLPTREQLDGAEKMIRTLLTLAEGEEPDVPWPSPGLQHEFYPKKEPQKHDPEPPVQTA